MSRKMSKEEERVTELVRQRMKESMVTELLGFDVESVRDGRAIFRLDVHPRHKHRGVYGGAAGRGTGHAGIEDQLPGAGARRDDKSGREGPARRAQLYCYRV